MILSRGSILGRLRRGQVFKEHSWCQGCLKEASYALRVAPDGLMLEGTHYRPGEEYIDGSIKINPGKIAILSTVERLDMPEDLVGKIGIRFKYACQGLTGLMGIQVDPFYGWGHQEERLFIRVANLGNDPILIPPHSEVFTFELHKIIGHVPKPSEPRPPMWLRIQDTLADQNNSSWSNVTQVQSDFEEVEKRVEDNVRGIRDYLLSLVMFGIFLVAVTILGVTVSVILSVQDTPSVDVPDWVTGWGWKLLLSTISIATVSTGAMGVVMVVSVARQLLRGNREHRSA